jgi:hypothetical protein
MSTFLLDNWEKDEGESCNKPGYDKKGAITAQNKRYRTEHVHTRIYPCPTCKRDGKQLWHLTHKL